MNDVNTLDVIVIGAGHAGLSAGYYLKQYGLTQLLLERGRIGESWISQRWDGFRLNTSNKLNTLPGCECDETHKNEFGSAKSLVISMQKFAVANELPILENAHVTLVERDEQTGDFVVLAKHNGAPVVFRSKQLIVASGAQSSGKNARLAAEIGPEIHHIHSSEYRNPDQLPKGAVLVVGSGQSGCQIAEDLINHSREVYLSTSKVPRCPRYYRGRDIMDWLILSGFFETRPDELPDPSMLSLRTPLLKGTDEGRLTLSLQGLAKKGVRLLGKAQHVVGNVITFSDDLLANLAFGDRFSEKVRAMVDGFIEENQIHAPCATADMEDAHFIPDNTFNGETHIDLNAKGVAAVIWATGFQADFNYLKLPVLDAAGQPVHRQGISAQKGLFFLGLHWQRSRKSDILFGLKDDARFVCEKVFAEAREWKSGEHGY